MDLNPQFAEIGERFVEEYYALFDDPDQRSNLVNYYTEENSLMTYEGEHFKGSSKILAKLQSFTIQKINRVITAITCQPMFDGGVLVNVLGRVQADYDPTHVYTQTFVLKLNLGSLFLQHDVFKMDPEDL